MSRNLVVRPEAYDNFHAGHVTSSSKYTEMDSVSLRVLSYFVEPCTVNRAFEQFAEEIGISEEEFDAALDEMAANNLLSLCDAGAEQTDVRLEAGGFADPSIHHGMLRDQVRVMAYRSAITNLVSGKRVLDLGCGSGILSVLAGKAGASHVVAIEETQIAPLAQLMAQANGLGDRFQLLRGNSLDLEVDEPVDVIIHELFGDDPLSENVCLYLADAKNRFLKPEGRLIPSRLEVYCLGIDNRDWKDPLTTIEEATELASMYGVEFAPYLDLLQHVEKAASKSVHEVPGSILSEACPLYRIDFTRGFDAQLTEPVEATLKIRHPGRLTSALLFFRAQLDSDIWLSTSPRAPKTHWAWPICDFSRAVDVSSGATVRLTARVVSIQGRDRIRVDLRT